MLAIAVKTNFPERRQAAYECANELFKIEISRVLRRSSLIEFRCIPRPNTVPSVPRSATIGWLLNPIGAPTLISPRAERERTLLLRPHRIIWWTHIDGYAGLERRRANRIERDEINYFFPLSCSLARSLALALIPRRSVSSYTYFVHWSSFRISSSIAQRRFSLPCSFPLERFAWPFTRRLLQVKRCNRTVSSWHFHCWSNS